VLGGKVVGCAVALGSTVMVGGTVVVRAVVPGRTVVVGAMVLGGTVGLVFADKSVEWRAIPRVIRCLGSKSAVGGHSFGAEPTDRGRRGSFHAVPAVAVAAADPDGSWITGRHPRERLAAAGLDSAATSQLGACLPRRSSHPSAARPQPTLSTPGASVSGPEEPASAG
jgi:hypothetical protein